MVKCLECNKEFGTITNTHLKSAHGMTIGEYLVRHPGTELMSEESKQLVSEAQLGNQNLLGYRHSKQAKQAISEAALGNQNLLGYKHTEEAKKAIRKTMLDFYASEEGYAVRVIMSKAAQGNQSALGHNHTEESKQAISKSLKEMWKDPEFAQRMVQAQSRKPNYPELRLQYVLDKHFPGEWKYVGDGAFWIEGKNPDFMNINGKKQVIEVFGEYWHSEDEVEPRIAHFREYGFDCIIFWEYDVYSEEEVVKRVRNKR